MLPDVTSRTPHSRRKRLGYVQFDTLLPPSREKKIIILSIVKMSLMKEVHDLI